MAPMTEQQRRAQRLVSLAASLRAVTQAPPPPPRRVIPWRWIIAFGAFASLIALPFIRGLRPIDFLVRRWQIETRLLGDVQAAARVHELSALGEDGIPLLVQALTDSRPRVAEAAKETLEREIQLWKELPLGDASARAARLLSTLRSSASQISPLVVDRVRALVVEILHWPVDDSAIDGVALVADCEYVLAALYRQAAPKAEVLPEDDDEAGDVAELADLPDEVKGALDEFPLVTTNEDEESEAAESSEEMAVSAPAAPSSLAAPKPVALLSQRPVPSMSTDPFDFAPLSVTDLALQLLDERAEIVVGAAQELQRRGFQSHHITLIERLFDPRPETRRAALEEIPRTVGFDSRPWLRHLSQDSDLSVRRTAIALLATSNDPETRRHLRQLESTEKDESILELIRQRDADL